MALQGWWPCLTESLCGLPYTTSLPLSYLRSGIDLSTPRTHSALSGIATVQSTAWSKVGLWLMNMFLLLINLPIVLFFFWFNLCKSRSSLKTPRLSSVRIDETSVCLASLLERWQLISSWKMLCSLICCHLDFFLSSFTRSFRFIRRQLRSWSACKIVTLRAYVFAEE